jgi:phage tail protein X
MATTSFDLITVSGDYVTVDDIVWRRYRNRAPGMVEAMLDVNPHLAKLHRVSPFLPVGTQLRIPIDPDILRGAPRPSETIQLYKR